MHRWTFGLALFLLSSLPTLAAAQNSATLLGTVTDESKAVLPGVAVTATEVSSGRQYVSTTDERGEYRLPSVLPGTYAVQAELSGFTTVRFPNVELLVGQIATLPFTLKLATLEETLTVTGAAPLINTQSAVVGGNIDRRQMQELPILGRNWMEMSMLVKGVTVNNMSGNRAGADRDDQLNLSLDGQQIGQRIDTSNAFGQPSLSREAVAEYQLSTSMYDVTQGRSVGLQVQAISRSGTNDLHGAVYGNFRDDALNAKDFIQQRVIPYSNQQAGASLGGAIVQNTLHYFGVYEYEREPNTVQANPQAWSNAPVSTLAFPTSITQHNTLVRLDYQVGAQDHISGRGTFWDAKQPTLGVAGDRHPSNMYDGTRRNSSLNANWSRVLSNDAVQEIKLGYTRYEFGNTPSAPGPLTPTYVQTGLPAIGAPRNFPQQFFTRMPSVRYDLTWHKSSHDLKMGGEFLSRLDGAYWPNQERGVFTVQGETAASWARRFPLDAYDDPSRWDLTGLRGTQYLQAFARDFNVDIPRKTWAVWLNDTWAVNNRLTLNYGVRWDVDWGAMNPPGGFDLAIPMNNGFDANGFNAGYTTGIRDLNDVAPRAGVTFKVNEGLVLRGGAGLFYGTQSSLVLTGMQQQITNERRVVTVDVTNVDNRPDFMTNPLGGVTPEQYLSGEVTPIVALRNLSPDYVNPSTLQVTGGFQQQIGALFGFDVDLLYNKGMHLGYDRDVNLFYDPVTGFPKNVGRFGRPRADYGSIRYYLSDLESEYLSLATSFTRRLSDRWQAGGTYTLMFLNKDHGSAATGYTALGNNPFCQTCEWDTTTAFQQHTIRLNGVYEAPWGVSLSGIFSFGSGTRVGTTYADTAANSPVQTASQALGANRYVTGAPFMVADQVTYPDGSTHSNYDRLAKGTPTSYQTGDQVPRNAFKGLPISKLDLRASKTVAIPGTAVKVTGMFEVFNLFNHENYSAYNTAMNVANFGRPNAALQPRTVQLAFRVAF